MPVPQAEVERRIGALQREVAHMQAMQDAQADITNRMAKRQAPFPPSTFAIRHHEVVQYVNH